jgi:hypothetical protein
VSVWLPIAGYEDRYEVSNEGEIRSIGFTDSSGRYNPPRQRKLAPNTQGYLHVGLRRDGTVKHRPVHLLVLETHVGPRPEGMQACHGPLGRLVNTVSNLRWDTVAANHEDKRKAGTTARGTVHGLSKLTEADVVTIRRRLAAGDTKTSIGKDYCVSRVSIANIQKGKTWVHV